MSKIHSILFSAFLVGCGGGGNSASDDTGLSGRYVGTLEGISCATNEQIAIDVTHEVDAPRPESSEAVTVLDDQGRIYNGFFPLSCDLRETSMDSPFVASPMEVRPLLPSAITLRDFR